MKLIAYIETSASSPILDWTGIQTAQLSSNSTDITLRRTSAMAKSYSEQLAEWVRQRTRSARHDRNLVAFLGVKEDVREALDQGWPVKTIWAHMVEQKRIGFGYDTFLIYVKRHVRPAAEPAIKRRTEGSRAPPVAPANPPASGSAKSRAQCPPVQVQPGQDQLPGFTFNAAPNREELI